MSKLFLFGLLVLSVVTLSTAFPRHEERDLQSILDKVHSVMESVGDKIREMFENIGDKLGEYKGKLVEGIKQLKDKVKELVQQGKEKIPVVKQEILDKIAELQKNIEEASQKEDLSFFERVQLGVAKDVLRVLENVVSLVPVPTTTEKRGLSDIFEELKSYLEKAASYVQTILENVGGKFGELKDKIHKQVEELREKVKELISAGKEKLPGIKQDVLDKIHALQASVKEASEKPDVSLVEKLMLTTAEKLLSLVENFVSNINVGDAVEERDLDSISESLKDFLEAAVERIHAVIDYLGGQYGTIKDKVKEKVTELKEKVKELIEKGKAKLPEVKQDILSKIEDLEKLLDDMANKEGVSFAEKMVIMGAKNVLSFLKSKVEAFSVGYVPEEDIDIRDIPSFIEAIKNAVLKATEAITHAVETVGEKLGVFKDKISEKVQEIKDKIKELIEAGKEKAPKVKQDILDKIKELKNTVEEASNQPDLWFWQAELLKLANQALTIVENTVSKINVE